MKAEKSSLSKKIAVFFAAMTGLLFSAAVAPAFAQTATPAAPTFLPYENPTRGFSMEYPAAWIPLEENDTTSTVIVSFVSLPETPEDQFAETVTVTSEVLPPAMTLQEYSDIGTQTLVTSFPDATIVEESANATLAGNPAHMIIFDTMLRTTLTDQPIGGRVMQIWTIVDAQAYVITFSAERAQYDQMVGTANTMIDSFTLTSTDTEANGTATSGNATEANATSLDEARQSYLSSWDATQLHEGLSTFIEPHSDFGYGIYTEHGSEIFRPGDTITLYVEPLGFSHTPVLDEMGNTLYRMNLTASAVMTHSNGTMVAAITDLPPIVVVSHKQNTELYLTVDVTQTEPLPEGEYSLTYTITDGENGESFEIEKAIRVAETVTI